MPFFLNAKKNSLVLAGLLLFQLILISLQIPLGERPTVFEKAVFAVFSPIQHGIMTFSQGLKNTWMNYLDLRKVRGENRKLRERNFELGRQNEMLRSLLSKYESEEGLKSDLSKINDNILPARIISWDFTNPYRSCLINRGSRDGIKAGMAVIDRNGVLVGKIVEPVSLTEARVQLLTSLDSGVSVYTERNELTGVLSGRGGRLCLLNYITASEEGNVGPGEKVFTSGQDEIFPLGIEVGRINSTTKSTSLFLEIEVQPSFDFKTLEPVAVIMLDPKRFF